MKNKVIEKKLDEMFKGIDMDVCESDGGWWETSTGADFGKRKLEELKQFIDSLYSEQSAKSAHTMSEGDLRDLFDKFYAWLDGLTQVEYDNISLTDKCEKFFFEINPTPSSAKSAHTMSEVDKIISNTEDEHPYKEAGNVDSYSEYNEGWTDACDVLGNRIKAALSTGSQSIHTISEGEIEEMAKEYSGFIHKEEVNDPAFERDVYESQLHFSAGFKAAIKELNKKP